MEKQELQNYRQDLYLLSQQQSALNELKQKYEPLIEQVKEEKNVIYNKEWFRWEKFKKQNPKAVIDPQFKSEYGSRKVFKTKGGEWLDVYGNENYMNIVCPTSIFPKVVIGLIAIPLIILISIVIKLAGVKGLFEIIVSLIIATLILGVSLGIVGTVVGGVIFFLKEMIEGKKYKVAYNFWHAQEQIDKIQWTNKLLTRLESEFYDGILINLIRTEKILEKMKMMKPNEKVERCENMGVQDKSAGIVAYFEESKYSTMMDTARMNDFIRYCEENNERCQRLYC